MESFRVMFVHGLLDGEALWSFLWMVIEWHIVDFKRVTMVGPCIVMICMLERRIIFDNNFMRHVQFVLSIKAARMIVVMDGMFVPVDLLFTRIIIFLGRLLLFLLWFFFLIIFRFLVILKIFLSQFIRFPFVFVVSIVRILNLWLIFIIMTFTDRRLVPIVVSVMLLNDLLDVAWLLQVEFVMVMLVMMAMASVVVIIIAIIFIVFNLVMMDVVILVFSWFYLPVVVNVTLRCVSISHFLYECMLNDRYLISIVVLLLLIIITI